ncbi:MAG: PD-(D/E)XK nuclease family protein [Nitrospira sp.]|nr:PD-(D/E)XK nuclease family protein [Nitrospira sp.]
MPVYSNSRLQTYENCPQQFKLKYIDRIKPPEGEEGIEAFLGTRVHDVLEKLYKELILTKLNPLEDLLEFYRTEWDKNWHENVVVVKKNFNKDHYYHTGIEAITNYYKRHHPFSQSKTLSTEHLVTFKIEDYSIQGYIDRLSHVGDGVYEIHDYKTSGFLPAQDKLDSDRQLALYQIGIKEKFRDAKDIYLKWHYLVFDKEFTSTRSDAQLKDLKKEVLSLIKTIEKDQSFKPVESNLCDWCEFDLYCPAKKHEIKVQDLPRNKHLKERGVSLVNHYASVKSKIRRLQDEAQQLQLELDLIEEAAIEYARNEEVTTITGSDYALRISEKMAYQFPRSNEEGREELEQFVKKAGIWEDVSGLNLARLQKCIDDEELDKKIRDRLLKFAEEIEKINVRLVKKREEE